MDTEYLFEGMVAHRQVDNSQEECEISDWHGTVIDLRIRQHPAAVDSAYWLMVRASQNCSSL